MIIDYSGLTVKAVLAYHDLYPDVKLSAMLSYGRRNKESSKLLFEYRKYLKRVALDCGTWTRNQNMKRYQDIITFRGYLSFLKNLKDRLDFYFNYDEDYSKDSFDTNLGYQLDMEKEGYKEAIPVIHNCYNQEINYYVDEGYKYIAIGSGELASASLDELSYIVNPLYRRGIKVHFLGCTEYRKLAYLPVFSADSSTWAQAGARDYIKYWNPGRSKLDKTDKIYLDERIWDYPYLDQLEDYLDDELGLEIDTLLGKGKHLNRQLVNIHYFVNLEDRINKKHKELGFTFD
jgi:hypothetical protein